MIHTLNSTKYYKDKDFTRANIVMWVAYIYATASRIRINKVRMFLQIICIIKEKKIVFIQELSLEDKEPI